MSALARITANTRDWPGRGFFSKVEAAGVETRFFHGESREGAIGEAERYCRDVLGMGSYVAGQDPRDELIEDPASIRARPTRRVEPAGAASRARR